MKRTRGAFAVGLTLLMACGAKSALQDFEPVDRSDGGVDAVVADVPVFDVPGVDTSFDASAPRDALTFDSDPPRPPRPCRSMAQPVDLLFVLDSSSSMVDEIAALEAQIPNLLRDLLEPPDRDRDGRADWAAIEDLHIAVAPSGRNGGFNQVGDRNRSECRREYPIFQRFRRGGDIDAFAQDVACVATTRFSGGEALFSTALRGLLPRDTEFQLPGEDPPLGDGPHAGFLREESLLVILFMTDEEDESGCTNAPDDICSTHCVDVPGIGEVCRRPTGSVAKYVQGMRLLRPPGQLLVATIAGAPLGVTDPDEILEQTLAAPPFNAICRNGLLGGQPSPRTVQLTYELDGIFLSLCADDYAELAGPLAERVGRIACEE